MWADNPETLKRESAAIHLPPLLISGGSEGAIMFVSIG